VSGRGSRLKWGRCGTGWCAAPASRSGQARTEEGGGDAGPGARGARGSGTVSLVEEGRERRKKKEKEKEKEKRKEEGKRKNRKGRRKMGKEKVKK
jgi:hypothetical protein